MTTMTLPTLAPVSTLDSFKLSITRRVYAIDLMTGERIGYLVRNYKLVG
jgi:hypothetical protein